MAMEALWEILPDHLRRVLREVPMAQVYEVRLRVHSPVSVCISGKNFGLGEATVTRLDLENIIHKAADYAIYAVLDQIVKGFITIRGGIRIGIAGELVVEHGVVTTIKNINSLCIRIPHAVKNCAYPILPYVFDLDRPYKTLIIAPPGAGKTTMLRDLAVQISAKYPGFNTLILDERGELAASYLGENQLPVGRGSDVITGGTKAFGFENGIRSLRPDAIITDEIATADDAAMIRSAARSGVVVFASVHAADLDEVREKPGLSALIQDGVFERYVVLTTAESAGHVVGVYDRSLRRL